LQAGFSYGRLQPAAPPRKLQQVSPQRFLLKTRLHLQVGLFVAACAARELRKGGVAQSHRSKPTDN
jgi:hypothetical protein